jgi:hypothetical protein
VDFELAVFQAGWARRTAQPGFRLALATEPAGNLIGSSYGHALTPDTHWWDGMLTPLPADRPGRTFAVIELAVYLWGLTIWFKPHEILPTISDAHSDAVTRLWPDRIRAHRY